jgi:hypothetical protein
MSEIVVALLVAIVFGLVVTVLNMSRKKDRSGGAPTTGKKHEPDRRP